MELIEDNRSKKILNVLTLVVIGFLVGCAFVFGTMLYEENNIRLSKVNEIQILSGPVKCSHLYLEDTSKCIVGLYRGGK